MQNKTFERLIPRGCGMDIHKKVVVATADTGDERITREFGTFTRSLTELRDWLVSLGITHVAMESTGVYWKPIHNVLEGYIPEVWIVNARHVKNVPGRKTDKKDSEWLCRLLVAGLLKPSFIPPRAQRELRDFTRYRRKLIDQQSANKNRIIRVLEDGNIKLSSVLTNTSGVTAERLIELLCSGEPITLAAIEAIRSKRCHHSAEEMFEACIGTMNEHKFYMLQELRRANKQKAEEIARMDAVIAQAVAPYRGVIERLCQIPGIQNRVCEELIAELGLDMSRFPSAKHLCKWAALCPGNNESAGKKMSSRTGHGNKYLRSILTEAAWAASKTKNTFYSERFTRIAARRGVKRAQIAIGHSILKAIYEILSTGKSYHELGGMYVPQKKEKQRKEYLSQELQKLGYKVTLTK